MKKDEHLSRNGSAHGGGLLPHSIRIISSCLKTVSSNCNSVASTVRLAGASVAASISVREEEKDQVVKDFVANSTISQLRAHTSPISALCFDTSGTLLVTASVHGNNINVFRIMPLRVSGDQDPTSYDWNASHVHLYKLHRGMTSAVIQDISFSNYSQWVAITSSRGTCHIFALSPFGGEVSRSSHASCADGSSLIMNPPSPWIKNNNGGWLNTVSGPLVTSTAKKNAPSGVVAAIFLNSVHHVPTPSGCSNLNPLEHLLVYSPSGHVIQHDLLPSSIMEPYVNNHLLIPGPGCVGSNEEEDFKIVAEPVQWWDVCWRLSWPEREREIYLLLHLMKWKVEGTVEKFLIVTISVLYP